MNSRRPPEIVKWMQRRLLSGERSIPQTDIDREEVGDPIIADHCVRLPGYRVVTIMVRQVTNPVALYGRAAEKA